MSWTNVLKFINDNSALWSLLVTIATIVYVILTYRLLKETQRARVESLRPYVIVDIDIHKYFLRLNINNIGNDNAFDIELKTEPLLKSALNKIAFLPPGKQIHHNLLFYVSEDIEIKNYTINISYKNYNKKEFSHTYDLDLTPLLDSMTSYGDDHSSSSIDFSKLISEIHNLEGTLKKTSDEIRNQNRTIDNLTRKLK
jgi:hypothetical protein